MYFSERNRFRKLRFILLISLLVFCMLLPGGLFRPATAHAEPTTLTILLIAMFVGIVIEVTFYIIEVQRDPEESYSLEGFCDSVMLGAAEGLLCGIIAVLVATSSSGAAAGAGLSVILAKIGVTASASMCAQVIADTSINILTYAEGVLEIKEVTPFTWLAALKTKIKDLIPCVDYFICSSITQNNPFFTNICLTVISELRLWWEDAKENGDLDGLQSWITNDIISELNPTANVPQEAILLTALPFVHDENNQIKNNYEQDEDIYLSYNISFNEEWCNDVINFNRLNRVVVEVYHKSGDQIIILDTSAHLVTNHYCGIGGANTIVRDAANLLYYAGLSSDSIHTLNLGVRVTAFAENNDVLDIFDTEEALIPITIAPPDNGPYFSSPSVTPNTPTSVQSTVFNIVYHDGDNDQVDNNSVKVYIDGSAYSMSGNSLEDGAVFSRQAGPFSVGNHTYYFIGSQNGVTFRYPEGSETLSFSVAQATADGLSLSASPSSLSICSNDSSTLTATLSPAIANQEVSFIVLEGEGYLYPSSDFTDANGQAQATFTPSEVGTVTIGALSSGVSMAQANITVSNCNVIIRPSMYLKNCNDTSSTYKIEADITDMSENDISNTDVKVTVKKTNGAIFGSLSDYDGHSGNPVNTKTDVYGEIDVFLDVTQEADIVVTIECMDTEKTFNNHVYAGCQPPANIPAFTQISTPGRALDDARGDYLAVSPDGSKLAAIADQWVVIYDLTVGLANGQWTPIVKLRPSDQVRGPLSVAWSPNGNYVAAGYKDPDDTDDPGAVIWTTGETAADFTHYRTIMGSNSYSDVQSIAWSPNSSYLITGEALSGTRGGGGRIWSRSGSNIWSSPQGADDVNAVAWSSSNYKAVGFDYDDGEARVWIYNSSNSRTANFRTYSNEDVYALEWNPTGNKLAVGISVAGSHAPIYLYDTNGNVITTFSEHNETTSGLDWHPTLDRLLSSSQDGIIKIWEDDGTPLLSFSCASVKDVCWSEDGTTIIAHTGNQIQFFAPYDSVGPSIIFNSPANGETTTASTIEVSGSIRDAHMVKNATIKVNSGSAVALSVDSSGAFSQTVTLANGSNEITVSAEDGAGNTSTQKVTVTKVVLNPDFSLSLTPSSRSVSAGQAAQFDITPYAVDGFSSSIAFSTSGVPSGTTSSFSPTSVSPGSTTRLTLTPSDSTATGAHQVTINATGGGKNHSTSITLNVVMPEINVRLGGVSVADNTGLVSYGTVDTGSTKYVSFSVENLGNASLSLTGSPRVLVGGANASDFTVTAQPVETVSALSSSSFTIAFTPSTSGTRSATVSIINNDANENPYNFSLSGTGFTGEPPDAPSVISYPSNDDDGDFTVTWSSVGAATGYTLQRSTNASFSGAKTVYEGSSTIYNERNLPIGKYFYRVRAKNNYGNSPWKAGGKINVCIDPEQPAGIDYPEINDQCEFTVSWDRAERADSYILERAENDSFINAEIVSSGASTSFKQKKLSAGIYYYRVKAVNSCGESDWLEASGSIEHMPPKKCNRSTVFLNILLDDLGK